MPTEQPASILANARQALATARLGLADFSGVDPRRRIPGFHNAVVFGRAVTNVLEHLRSKVEDFDSWYKPRAAALGEDAGFARLYAMRSEILKEGSGQLSRTTHVEYLNTADLQPLMNNPPPGAKSFFIGDQTGGSGWEVDVAEGETETFYVQLPDTVRMSVKYEIGDEDAAELLGRYLDEMDAMIREARARFGL